LGVDNRKACFYRKPHYLKIQETNPINDRFYDTDFAQKKYKDILGTAHNFGMGNKGLFLKKLNENPGPGTHKYDRGVVSTMLITGKKRIRQGKVMWPPLGNLEPPKKKKKSKLNKYDY